MDALFLATVSPAGKVLIGLVAFAILAPPAWRMWQGLITLWIRCPECGSTDLDEAEPRYDFDAMAHIYPLTCRVCGHRYERTLPFQAGSTQSPV